MGKFEINKDKAGKFRFNLKAGNHQVILSSQGYATKSACENGIESVRKNSKDDKMFDRKKAKDGSPYFSLKSSNGQAIGSSEMYSSTSAMSKGIASIKKNAPKATVQDISGKIVIHPCLQPRFFQGPWQCGRSRLRMSSAPTMSTKISFPAHPAA